MPYDNDGNWVALYDPTKDGLELIQELDVADSYEFCIFRIYWNKKDRRYYWATDSGCSCPTPFEDYSSLSDYSSGTKQEALAAIKNWANDGSAQYHRGEGRIINLYENVLRYRQGMR